MAVFSYVVDHDNGHAPNPYFDLCTLCRCKFSREAEGTQGLRGRKNIVELAKVGDWVVGTGGASQKSVGHGKLVYAMCVEERLTRWEYFSDTRFAGKKPRKSGNYADGRGDNIKPNNDFEKYRQFALISSHFYYFGACAIDIPERFKPMEKSGPGFRYIDPEQFREFLTWLERKYSFGKHGEPFDQVPSKATANCKSSC